MVNVERDVRGGSVLMNDNPPRDLCSGLPAFLAFPQRMSGGWIRYMIRPIAVTSDGGDGFEVGEGEF